MHGATGVRSGNSVPEGSYASQLSRKLMEAGDVFAALLAEFEQHEEMLTVGHERLDPGGEEVNMPVNSTVRGNGEVLPSLIKVPAGDSLIAEWTGWMIEWEDASKRPISDEDFHNNEIHFAPYVKSGWKERAAIPTIEELRKTAWQLLHSEIKLDPALRAKLEKFLKRDMDVSEMLETASILLQVWQWGHSADTNVKPLALPVLDRIGKAASPVDNALRSFSLKTSTVRRSASAMSKAEQETEQAEGASLHSRFSDLEAAEQSTVVSDVVSDNEAEPETQGAHRASVPFDGEDGAAFGKLTSDQRDAIEQMLSGNNVRQQSAAAADRSQSDVVAAPSASMTGRTRETSAAASMQGEIEIQTGEAGEIASRRQLGAASPDIHVSSLTASHPVSVKSTIPNVQTSLSTTAFASSTVEDVEPTSVESIREQHGAVASADARAAWITAAGDTPESQTASQAEWRPTNPVVMSGNVSGSYGLFGAVETVYVGSSVQMVSQTPSVPQDGTPFVEPSAALNRSLKTVSEKVDVNEGTESGDGNTKEDVAAGPQSVREPLQSPEWSAGNRAEKVADAADAQGGRTSGEGVPATTEPADASLLHHAAERANRAQHAKASIASSHEVTTPPDPQRLSNLIRSAVLEQSHERQTILLQLEPEELGRLQLRVAVENGAVTAHFVAETEAARRIIEAGIQQLKDSLYNHGVDIQDVEVSLGHEGGFGERHDHQANARTMERFMTAAQRNRGITAVESALQAVYSRTGGVDVLI